LIGQVIAPRLIVVAAFNPAKRFSQPAEKRLRGIAPRESIENAATQRDDSRAQPEAARLLVTLRVTVLREGGREPGRARLVDAQRVSELRDGQAIFRFREKVEDAEASGERLDLCHSCV
jgi:hypothetical protein